MPGLLVRWNQECKISLYDATLTLSAPREWLSEAVRKTDSDKHVGPGRSAEALHPSGHYRTGNLGAAISCTLRCSGGSAPSRSLTAGLAHKHHRERSGATDPDDERTGTCAGDLITTSKHPRLRCHWFCHRHGGWAAFDRPDA